jgi:hypothetical protein
MNNERILCAAIHYDDKVNYDYSPQGINTGFVICGYRHNNCIEILKVIYKESSNVPKGLVRKSVQGFLTSKNRFVTRKEAFKIFFPEPGHKQPFDSLNDELFSEDLY